MGPIRDLYNEYKTKPEFEDEAAFGSVLTQLIDKAHQIDPANGTRKIFDRIFNSSYNIKLYQIKAMIDISIDCAFDLFPKYCDSFSDKSMDYFLSNYHITLTNANIINKCFDRSYKLSELTTIKLLDKFATLTDDHIHPIWKLDHDWPKLVDYLLDRGISGNTFANFFNKLTDKSDDIDNTGPQFIQLLSSGRITIDGQLMAPILAIFCDYLELTINQIECLICFGADPRYNNDQLFIDACGWKDQSIAIHLYIRYNCDVNAGDINSRYDTPLSKAFYLKNNQIIKMLLDNGAKPTARILSTWGERCLPYIDYFLNAGFSPMQIAGLILRGPFLDEDDEKTIVKMLVAYLDFGQILTL